MTIVTGKVRIGSGVPPSDIGGAFVAVRPVGVAVTTTGDVLLPSPSRHEAATDGAFSIEFAPLPAGFAYEVIFVLKSGAFASPPRIVQVPAAGTVAYADLVDVVPAPGTGYGPPSWYASVLAARDETIVTTSTGSWSGVVSLTQAEARSKYLRRTLTGNVTLLLPAGVTGVAYSLTLELAQDATGGRTLTVANAATSYGVEVVLSTGANQVDLVHCLWNGSAWRVLVGAQALAIPATWVV